jgi:hypothetical protein
VCGIGEAAEHQYLPKKLEALKGVNITQIAACGFHTAVQWEGESEGGRERGSEGGREGGGGDPGDGTEGASHIEVGRRKQQQEKDGEPTQGTHHNTLTLTLTLTFSTIIHDRL